jgi:hypothetical protein
MKTILKLFALLSLMLAALGQYGSARALSGPVFDYPVDGQDLDYEGSYLFRVLPMDEAQGFLWGFFQNGVMVWENYRDEGVLSGNEYGIHPGTVAHAQFVPGDVEVWVRAQVDGNWTDATVITIHLVPRAVYAVSIDIKPGDPSNRISVRSKGAIQVAILSTDEFDALALVDRASLTFGNTGSEASLISCQKKGKDVNRDGLPDLLCDFSVRLSGLRPGSTVGILMGYTIDETPIAGSDSVKVSK